MGGPGGAHAMTGESLLRMGRSLRVLAVVVILTLAVGLEIVSYTGWQGGGLLNEVLGARRDLLAGFAFLMLLTVGYLVGKGWATTRYQGVLMHQLVEEQAVARALRLDPILEFHHPQVCREILMRQANYAARMNQGLALIELTLPELPKMWSDPETRPVVEAFFREIRLQCRPLDFWVRWTPTALLLVVLQVNEQDVAGVVYRLRGRSERWWEQQDSLTTVPRHEWRYRTVPRLGATEDILEEVRRLLGPDNFVATPMANVWQPITNPPGTGSGSDTTTARGDRA